ncbi:DUF6314 family protein [Herbaspirillum sp. YR522]|uniref:DUF6314 family protein n=1 Tax=Herbaspirillum sp. YR522 TaxID=1144342 RepID=UPI00026FAB56|nr:DUF6314 family protein [Herbaspirillum sp. YR522]EJN00506.1 hypothetical protein PMI40_03575 [Herbaspirillum sp. YR522]
MGIPGDNLALQDFFSGAWIFDRSIWGADETVQAQASGACEFSRLAPDLLRYREHGTLHMAQGRPIAFTRLFDYRFDAHGVMVSFADGERAGQPYQHYVLDGNRLAPAAQHLCGADCYTASYLLEAAGQFQQQTWIRGPHKHTRLLTTYRRAGS